MSRLKRLRRPLLAVGFTVGLFAALAPSCDPATPNGQMPLGHNQAGGPQGTWNLKFSDEFNGTSLDTDKWNKGWHSTNDPTPPVQEQETACYGHSQITEGYGSLVLYAQDVEPDPTCGGETREYLSGAIESSGKYNFSYGLIEARIWLDSLNGEIPNWPAFWTNGENPPSWPDHGEIDVAEGLEGSVKSVWHGPGGSPAGQGFEFGDHGVTSGWHTYSVEWKAGQVISYLDGVVRGQYSSSTNITNHPQYIIFGMQMSPEGQWGGPVKAPSSMIIDYVRVWQR